MGNNVGLDIDGAIIERQYLSTATVVAQGSVREILTPRRIGELYGIDVTVIAHPTHNHPLIVTN